MARRTRTSAGAATDSDKRPGRRSATSRAGSGAAAAVGARQPCPCGSGRRYKSCHGAPGREAPFVVRTFAGLPGECDWVALREFVQCGTAPLTLRPGAFEARADGAEVLVSSVLPGIAPALRRDDGAVWLAVQVAHQSADPSTDIARALDLALDARPGESVSMPDLVGAGQRLQDVVDADAEFTVTVRDGFDYWFEGMDDPNGAVAATLEQLNDTIEPTVRLSAVEAAYWTRSKPREFVRWVLPHDEEQALSALARLHAANADGLVEDSRLVGSFRAHGLLAPVWELPTGTGAEAHEETMAEVAERLSEALADDTVLTDEQRAARHGLTSRQLTIR